MVLAARGRDHQAHRRFAGQMARNRKSAAIKKIDHAGIAKHHGIRLNIGDIIRDQPGDQGAIRGTVGNSQASNSAKRTLRFRNNFGGECSVKSRYSA